LYEGKKSGDTYNIACRKFNFFGYLKYNAKRGRERKGRGSYMFRLVKARYLEYKFSYKCSVSI